MYQTFTKTALWCNGGRNHSKNGASPKSQMSRKNFLLFSILLFVFVLLQSCGASEKIGKGTIGVTNVPKPEIIVQPELREFLKNNPKPSIVLRVPATTSNVTTTESGNISEYNSLYGRIEKELKKVGYIVRDRSMLNEVLSSGKNVSYQEIGEKIQTDIILEIISISKTTIDKQNIDIQTDYTNADIKQDLLNSFIIEKYIVDCKIVLVNSGTTVGMSTSNYCHCNKSFSISNGCNIEFKVIRGGSSAFGLNALVASLNDVDSGSGIYLKNEADSKWYNKLTYGIPMEDLSEMVANDLIKIFKGQ